MTDSIDPAPYAPPPIIEGDEPTLLEPGSVPRVPFVVTLSCAAVATILTVAYPFRRLLIGFDNRGPFDDGTLYISILVAPPIAIAGFVLLCFFIMDQGNLAPAKSIVWKLFMTLLVPFAAMLLFVPTCIGSGMFTLPFVIEGLGDIAMAIPVFIAFWVTLSVVAMRLHKRLSIRVQNTGQSIANPTNLLP